MKSKNGFAEIQLFKNEKIEFDEEGFLITKSMLIPIKKRPQRMNYDAIINSRIDNGSSPNKNSVIH